MPRLGIWPHLHPLNPAHVNGNVRASVHDLAAATLKNFPDPDSGRGWWSIGTRYFL